MTHRVDLKILGFESKKFGTKDELTKEKNKLESKGYECKIVPYEENKWELYVKKS